MRSPPQAPQAQPSIPRPIRLFLRQLRASHLGGELEGESQKLLVGYPKLWLQAFLAPLPRVLPFYYSMASQLGYEHFLRLWFLTGTGKCAV